MFQSLWALTCYETFKYLPKCMWLIRFIFCIVVLHSNMKLNLIFVLLEWSEHWRYWGHGSISCPGFLVDTSNQVWPQTLRYRSEYCWSVPRQRQRSDCVFMHKIRWCLSQPIQGITIKLFNFWNLFSCLGFYVIFCYTKYFLGTRNPEWQEAFDCRYYKSQT